MDTSPQTAGPPPSPRQPQLQVPWDGGWKSFRQAVGALWARLPELTAQATRISFRGTNLRFGWPGGGLLASALWHIAFIVLPLPGFLTAWQPPKTFSTVRIEYDLTWAPGSLALPPMAPAERPKPQPTQEARLKPPLPPQVPTLPAPQVIVSEPRRPNHPTQTLLSNFPQARVPVDTLDVRLPNLVIPKVPTAAPKVELNLRRLSLPRAVNPASSMPLPPRPPSAAERELAESRLEQFSPRLNTTELDKPRADAPEVGATLGTTLEDGATPPALVALSAQPALPSEVLELPETQLRARFAAGPELNNFGGEAPGISETGTGVSGLAGSPGALSVPGVLVAGNGPLPPAPVVVGPPSGGAKTRAELLGLPRKRPQVRPTTSAQNAKARAEEMLSGIQPGSRPLDSAGAPRVYTIYITMPNLTSQAGSWVLRFSEQGPASRTAAGGAANGFPLEAPLAIKKVDPRYLAPARRARIEGVVVLYGVIRADGGVESVQVVRSLDESLDASAVEAFRRWVFEPGRKNGLPVPLEVVVEIPFRLARLF